MKIIDDERYDLLFDLKDQVHQMKIPIHIEENELWLSFYNVCKKQVLDLINTKMYRIRDTHLNGKGGDKK